MYILVMNISIHPVDRDWIYPTYFQFHGGLCVCVCVCTQPQVGHQKSRDLLQPNFSCFHVRSMSCQHLWFQKNILMNFKVHFAEAHSAQHSGGSSARIHRASRTSSVTKKLSLLLCPFIQYIGHHRSV